MVECVPHTAEQKIELLSVFGDDLMVVNAARVSYNKTKEKLDDKDIKLLKYLVTHGHSSPFRHPQLQFRVKCPIYVERQLLKHEIGINTTVNSISGRYVDFSDSYELPTQLRFQSQDSKQGSLGDFESDQNDKLLTLMRELIENTQEVYAYLCDQGVAKEQARCILPLCLETTFIWTGSLQAFIHMCKLRLSTTSQKETADVVRAMLALVRNFPAQPFKYSLEAFQL